MNIEQNPLGNGWEIFDTALETHKANIEKEISYLEKSGLAGVTSGAVEGAEKSEIIEGIQAAMTPFLEADNVKTIVKLNDMVRAINKDAYFLYENGTLTLWLDDEKQEG